MLRRSFLFWCFSLTLALTSVIVVAEDYSAVTSDGKGAIATVHPLATQAAINAFAKGGNAIDAGVAAAMTLGVVDGHNSGIGGGCFILVHMANGEVVAIDGREMAPAGATRNMYIRDGKVIPSLSRTGPLAVGIPGSVAAYEKLMAMGGKLSFAEVVNPAADIAEKGFPIDGVYAGRLARAANSIKEFAGAKAVLLDAAGQPWPEGHQLIQKDLAMTYRGIAKEGASYFYRGAVGKQIGEWMENNGGVIVADDFANYQLKLRQPVATRYRGYSIYGFPPPSSGGIHVGQILNILEFFDLAALDQGQRYHLLTEAMKLAFADRAYWLGDPDYVNVPRGLIDKGYAESLAKKIDLAKATVVDEHGTPPDVDSDIFGKHTTHIAAADAAGNWVAITTTVNTGFGSKIIVPGTGVILNNQMDDFSAQPGSPNSFRLVGAEANSVGPGKRPLSSMSPTVVTKDGKPILTAGAAGGPTIITGVLQILVNYLDLNMSLDDAMVAPRIHHQWSPDRLFAETALPAEVKTSLEAKGHKVQDRTFISTAQAIGFKDGKFTSVTEPRILIRNGLNAEP